MGGGLAALARAGDGCRHADPGRGLHKLAVLERHGVNGNVGRGFVQGFGPMHGAIATSIGHDCHNLIVIGSDDADMALAVNRLIAMQGGIAVVRQGEQDTGPVAWLLALAAETARTI